ncbi:MoaD/ThiS family protein [Isosphaeraceae bacterium EP7]
MRVTLQLFALARQRAGRDRVELDLPDPATVADLKAGLARAVPELAALIGSMRFAVDEEYADDLTTVLAGSSLAAIPPVSGGATAEDSATEVPR